MRGPAAAEWCGWGLKWSEQDLFTALFGLYPMRAHRSAGAGARARVCCKGLATVRHTLHRKPRMPAGLRTLLLYRVCRVLFTRSEPTPGLCVCPRVPA